MNRSWKWTIAKTVLNWRWWLVLPLAIAFLPMGLVGWSLQKLPSCIEAISEGFEEAVEPIRLMFGTVARWVYRDRYRKPSP